MKNKIYTILATIFSLTMVGFAILFWVWYLYPYNIIEFNSVTPSKNEYRVGEVLELKVDYCKYKDLPTQITRQFMNGIIFKLSDVSSGNTSVGCDVVIIKDIRIPRELLPDDYIYKQTMVYHPNPVRDIVKTFEVSFKVVE